MIVKSSDTKRKRPLQKSLTREHAAWFTKKRVYVPATTIVCEHYGQSTNEDSATTA
ncbi:unnamed protein product, partial [Ceratitis capitata]